MTIEEALKIVRTATWQHVKHKTNDEKIQMAEAMGRILAEVKIAEFLKREVGYTDSRQN